MSLLIDSLRELDSDVKKLNSDVEKLLSDVKKLDHAHGLEEQDNALLELGKEMTATVEELRRMVNELSSGHQEQDVALQELDNALQEQDVALQEQDVALQELDNALQEHDSALEELHGSLKTQDSALKELDSSPKTQVKARKARDSYSSSISRKGRVMRLAKVKILHSLIRESFDLAAHTALRAAAASHAARHLSCWNVASAVVTAVIVVFRHI